MSRLPAEKRREQLLDCAAELFAKMGYARATTAELAKSAGVTEPIIYRHFASKRDLFIALIERTAKQTLKHWQQSLADASDPAERLRRVLGDNPMVSPEGSTSYRVLLQATTEVDDPEIRKAVTGHFVNLHAFLAKEIKRAQEERKVMRVFSAELIAWILIHVGLGYGSLAAMGVEGQGIDKEGQHVQDMLTRLLVGRSGEERNED
jgi:AcrR family transcriptional regulator